MMQSCYLWLSLFSIAVKRFGYKCILYSCYTHKCKNYISPKIIKQFSSNQVVFEIVGITQLDQEYKALLSVFLFHFTKVNNILASLHYLQLTADEEETTGTSVKENREIEICQ